MKHGVSTVGAFLLVLAALLAQFVPGRAQDVPEKLTYGMWRVATEYMPPGDEPMVLIAASVQQCVGCAVLAINRCIEQVHDIRPDAACVVLILTDDPRDVETIRERFATPYVLAVPPGQSSFSSSGHRLLPAVFVVDGMEVVFSHYDVQHSPMDTGILAQALDGRREILYTVAGASVAAELREPEKQTTDFDDTRGYVLLQEPDDRSVAHLASVVWQPATRILYGINTLTNGIERWDEEGRLLTPLTLPDTVKYFFRVSPDDPVWSLLEDQGYDVMEVTALTVVDRTVYALVTLLSGYDVRTVVEQSGTVQQFVWDKSQVVVQITDGVVRDILPLPSHYSFLDLAADSTTVSGTCVDATTTISGYTAADSVAFLATVDIAPRNSGDGTIRDVTVWKQQNAAPVSIGRLCANGRGTLWYCDPQHRMLLVRRTDGSIRHVEPRGVLNMCGGSVIAAGDSDTARTSEQPYILQDMTAGNEVALLLVPAIRSDLPCVVQFYSATTGFLGERLPGPELTGRVRQAHLAGIDEQALVFLARTDRWKLLRIPLPSVAVAPASQAGALPDPAR